MSVEERTADYRRKIAICDVIRKLNPACLALLVTSFAALAQNAPSQAARDDLAPTGKLRAAINFGNGVLAQKGPGGEPRGISAEFAAALA